MITLEDLQGAYDISYQSTPQLDGWFEPGNGAAKIEGTSLRGIDGIGATWEAEFELNNDNSLSYRATVDPSKSPPGSGLMGKDGQMTREPQNYSGTLNVTQNGKELILRTTVQQGPITIRVQFRKRT